MEETSDSLTPEHGESMLFPTTEIAVKLLFLSSDPDHVTSEKCSEKFCYNCHLLDILEKHVNDLHSQVVQKFLQERLSILANIKIDRKAKKMTFAANLRHKEREKDKFPREYEEILTLCGSLEMMKLSVPPAILKKRDEIVTNHKIPIEVCDGSDEKISHGFTSNVFYTEVAHEMLPEEVLKMAEIIKIGDYAKLTKFSPVVKRVEQLKLNAYDSRLKEALFYYIILSMEAYGVLNKMKTLLLQSILSKVSKSNPNREAVLIEVSNKLNQYFILPKTPGLCMIFVTTHNRNPEALTDMNKLKILFETIFSFEVFIVENPSPMDIHDFKREVSAMRYMFYDSLVVFFLGYGDKRNMFLRDGEINRETDVVKPIAEIKWLAQKPKLFFFQVVEPNQTRAQKAGSHKADPIVFDATDSVSMTTNVMTSYTKTNSRGIFDEEEESHRNVYPDTLISYSTKWNQEPSDPKDGTLFIRTLVQFMEQYGESKNIEDILQMVHLTINVSLMDGNLTPEEREMNTRRSPHFESALLKKCVFPSRSKKNLDVSTLKHDN